ncbi:MAG: hypothetical protein WCH39_25145, partial [Schlesneria sp.]
LQQLGRSVEELEQAATAVKKRRSLRMRVEAGKSAEAKQKKAEKDIEAAASKFDPIKQQYEATVEKLSGEVSWWRQCQADADEALRDLSKTCSDEELLAEYQAAQRAEQEAQQTREAAQNERDRLADIVIRDEHRMQSVENTGEKSRLSDLLSGKKSELRDAESRLTEATNKCRDTAKVVSDFRLKLADSEL